MSRISTRTLALAVSAIAAAIVLVSASTAWRATAVPGPSESTIVNVVPQRILDTRDGIDLGLTGPFVSGVSQKLQVTGSVRTANGTMEVVPSGATGVLLNVTSVRSTADGFISVRPGDVAGSPTTSSLNFKAGVTTPNAVQVSLPTSGTFAGKIDIVYVSGSSGGPTTDVLVDVVGFTTSSGLADLTTELAQKADAADVYTKAQSDERFVPHGEIVLSHATANMSNHGPGGDPATKVLNFADGTVVSGDGVVTLSLVGPATIGGVDYGLESIEYCIDVDDMAGANVGVVWIEAQNSSSFVEEFALRNADGCYVVDANLSGAQAYGVEFQVGGGGGTELTFVGVQSTWEPVSGP